MKDRLLGLAVILLAGGLYWFGRDLQAPISYEPVGPRAFPLLLAALLGVVGLLLLVRGAVPGAAVPGGATAPVDDTPVLGPAVIATLVAVACYAGLFETFGFVIATAAMTIAVGRLFGGRWIPCAAVGVCMGIGLFVLFDKLLDVTLPLGLLAGLV